MNSRTLPSTPESGARAGYIGAKRQRGSKLHLAVDTLGHLLALHVAAASADERAEVEQLAAAVQEATDDSVSLAYLDQGYTGQRAAEAVRGEEELRAAASTLDGGALVHPDHAVPPSGQELRALHQNAC